MIFNRIHINIFLTLLLLTVVMAGAVIDLAKDREDSRQVIADLDAQVNQLKESVSYYSDALKKEKEERDLRQFKENVFQLRYPKFSKTARVVFQKSKEYGFNPYLVMGIIQVESDFDRFAVSTAGAYGLMQVNFSVWKDVYDIDYNRIFETEYNVDLGLKILKRYYEKCGGNMLKALFRYNNGYLYNNTAYSGKIIATNFYANRNKAVKKVEREKTTPM